MEEMMKVSKWGNSLAIRIPADIAAKLGVKEGDELYTIPGMAEEAQVTIKRKLTLDEMWARVEEIRNNVKAPENFRYNREADYEEWSNNRWKRDE
jgi:antitoxin MazE